MNRKYFLHRAVAERQYEALSIFLESPTKDLEAIEGQRTPMRLAVELKSAEAIERLGRAGARTDDPFYRLRAIFDYQVRRGLLQVPTFDVNGRFSEDVRSVGRVLSMTMVEGAVHFREFDALREFVAAGADVNLRDEIGATPLLLALIESTSTTDFVEMIRFLLASGADPKSALIESKLTALHYAAYRQSAELVNDLLQHGASPNALDADRRTPLVLTIYEAGYTYSIVSSEVEDNLRRLVAAGTDLSLKDNRGKTALGAAKSFQSRYMEGIVRYLESIHAPE